MKRTVQGPSGHRGLLVRMLAQCGERLQSHLGPLVDAAFRRVDDALYDLADKAESDRHYSAHFEALRLVRRERAALKRRFLRNLADGMSLFQDVRNSLELAADSSRFDSEDLSLVDDEDLEESLVLANMVSKAENRYQQPLRDLADHFGTLVGHQGLMKPEHIPVSPHAIGAALSAAVQSVPDMDLATALVIYKVFDKQVMDNLDAAYTACLEVAAGLGLKPAARGHRIIRQPSAPDHRRAGIADASAEPGRSAAARGPAGKVSLHTDAAAAASAASGGTGGGGTVVPHDFEQLRVLLHGDRVPLAEPAGVPLVDTTQLLHSLSRMQQGTELRGDQPLAPSQVRSILVSDLAIRSSLDRGSAAGSVSRRLDSRDADVMDLVFLLFEQILAAPDIPDALKVVVSRLQVPYVKVALIEPGFFDAPDNAARALLDRIALLSIGWNDDGERGPEGLYGRIRHVVERVVTEFQTDPTLFSALDADLARYQQQYQREARLAEARTIQVAGARDEHQRTRRRVMEAIDQRLGTDDHLPVVINSIVRDGFAQLMLRTLEGHGDESHAWRQALRLLDRLLWSIEPKPDPAARRELLRRIPELLRRLREQLGQVISDQQLIARWLKELQTLHIAVLRGPTAGGSAAPNEQAPVPPEQGPGGESLSDVDALPLGTWVAIARDDGTWFRAKLAWRAGDAQMLVLVDQRGRKGFEMSRDDLAALFEQGLAEVIGDGRQSLVTRAMAAVRQNLSHR